MNSKLLLAGCLSILVSFFTSLNAQVFQPLGSGITNNNYVSWPILYEDQGDVYVFYEEIAYNPYTRTSHLVKWDGFSWTTLPNAPRANVRSMIVYDGDFYVAADDLWGNGGLFKFNGSGWVSQLSGFSGYITDMIIDNNVLICGGSFTYGTPAKHGILGFDGANTVSIPSLSATDSVADVNIIGSEIWVAGDFEQPNFQEDSVDVKRLTNGTTWERPAEAFKVASQGYAYSVMQGVFEYNNKIYCGGYNGLFEIDNDTAYTIDNSLLLVDYTEFNGLMYFAETYYNRGIKIFNGTTVSPMALSPNQIYSITSSNTHLYASFGDTTRINGVDFGHVLRMGPQTLGLLQGKAYLDNNSNCTYDAAIDAVAPAMSVQIPFNGGNLNGFTDGQGNYSMYLPAGTYPIQVPQSALALLKHYAPSCNFPSLVTLVSGQTTIQDFVLAHDGSIDLESEIFINGGHRSRQGFTEPGYVYLRNSGAAISSPVTVNLTVPSTVTFISSSPAPTSSSGNVYTYTFPNMAQASQHTIQFNARIDFASNSIGDTLVWYSDIIPVSGDIDASNDNDSTWTRVTGAYDPNDKTANEWQSLPGLSRLDYHIRFQNTGTDTAYKVVIVDTLESYFDPASITINGASHDYSFNVSDNNVIAWTFDNILLPDSGANYAGSQGFVNFSIDVDPTLQVGDIIDNDAEIYFDFQLPVHTNHAQTAIVSVLGVEELFGKETSLSIYPNPARNLFYIENSVNEKQDVKLIDATGRIIKSISLQPETKAEVRADSLAPGIYFINNGENAHRVIITK